MFAGFVAAIAPAWLYLSASENLQLVNSYLKETGHAVSWMDYFISNFPRSVLHRTERGHTGENQQEIIWNL